MCQNWGYERLAVKIRAESIGEMNHAEKVIERIRHLEGIPNLTRLEEIRVGERAVDQLQFDLEVENVVIGRFNRLIKVPTFSVVGSSALVASSRIRNDGSLTRARAISRRWRCPPEKLTPPSAT